MLQVPHLSNTGVQLIAQEVPLVALSTVSKQPHEVLVSHPPDCFDLNLEFPLSLAPNKPSTLLNSATQKPHVTQITHFSLSNGSYHAKHANNDLPFFLSSSCTMSPSELSISQVRFSDPVHPSNYTSCLNSNQLDANKKQGSKFGYT